MANEPIANENIEFSQAEKFLILAGYLQCMYDSRPIADKNTDAFDLIQKQIKQKYTNYDHTEFGDFHIALSKFDMPGAVNDIIQELKHEQLLFPNGKVPQSMANLSTPFLLRCKAITDKIKLHECDFDYQTHLLHCHDNLNRVYHDYINGSPYNINAKICDLILSVISLFEVFPAEVNEIQTFMAKALSEAEAKAGMKDIDSIVK